jgi:hypothetical protein
VIINSGNSINPRLFFRSGETETLTSTLKYALVDTDYVQTLPLEEDFAEITGLFKNVYFILDRTARVRISSAVLV